MQKASKPSLPALDDPSLYINRDLSWLEFNRRVLEEGCDPSVPLLERLKFLAIFTSNLDEFFMVRVGGVKQKVHAKLPQGTGADRMNPKVQYERIGELTRSMVAQQYNCLNKELLPSLEKEGIILRKPSELTEDETRYLTEMFQREIYPVLTPLAIDPGHPFPHLLNHSLNLAVRLHRTDETEKLYAVVQVPGVLPRFVKLPSPKHHVFIPLESVIRLHLPDLFRGLNVSDATPFQVTRYADIEIIGDEVDDLLKTIETEIRKRRRGFATRMVIAENAPEPVESFLREAFDLEPGDVYRTPEPLDLTALFQIYGIADLPHLRDPKMMPQKVAIFAQSPNLWEAIRQKDILVQHPYESFEPVVDFIRAASKDERVLAIKQTLYRTGSDSPIVRALQQAALNGKQVTAVVELKARMDEERNIVWARKLERAGVHVVFGFVGLKTHCKVSLVVRREDDGIRRYVHLGTGNYNSQTARLYTDLGLFTCDPAMGDDVSELFNYLTGYCQQPQWRKLIVAPTRLLPYMVEKIRKETSNQLAGKKGKIVAKVNGILEPEIIQELYKASQAGVQIDLICRGICALRPGVPGISDHIRVISIVDRFLEHSRVYYFENGGDPIVLAGSADWMDRNLKRRVEVVFPIEDPNLKQFIIRDYIPITLGDNVKARELKADGHYDRVKAKKGETAVRSQERFQEIAANQNILFDQEATRQVTTAKEGK